MSPDIYDNVVQSVLNRPSIVPPANNLPYLIAIVLMSAVGTICVSAVAIMRGGQDNIAIYGAIAAFIGPTTLSLLAFMKSQETHLSVNSRLDAFMRNAELAAHVKGIIEGRSQGRDSANARTDALAGEARDAVAVVAATAAASAAAVVARRLNRESRPPSGVIATASGPETVAALHRIEENTAQTAVNTKQQEKP